MYENLIATLATCVADLRAGERNLGIRVALEHLRVEFAADRCCIHMLSAETDGLAETLGWCVDGNTDRSDPAIPLAHEIPTRALEVFKDLEIVSDSTCCSGEENAVGKNARHTSIFVPLVTHGAAVGVLTLERLQNREKPPGSMDSNDEPCFGSLRVAGDILAGAVEQFRVDESMKKVEEQLRTHQRLETLGRLSGGVAHDFNNFLTAIIGNCELLSDELGIDKPQLEEIDEIRRAAERASILVDRILTFGRETGSKPRAIDVNWVVADMEKLIARLVGDDVDVVSDLAEGCGVVHADPGQIEQILLNLVVNARDAMPSGGTLSIRVAELEVGSSHSTQCPERAKPGKYVELSVHDDGCGMKEEDRERLFDPFYTTKACGKGTGLGLATVAGIVRELDGVIRVESEEGKSSTFSVLMPCAQGVEDSTSQHQERHAIAGGAETILVVEEENLVRQLLRRVLENDGYTVLEATDGESAVEVSVRLQGPIDLVVTDLALPHLRGQALVRKLQEHRPQLRALYTSCYPESIIREEGVLKESEVFVEKPFGPHSLVRGARHALDMRGTADPMVVMSPDPRIAKMPNVAPSVPSN